VALGRAMSPETVLMRRRAVAPSPPSGEKSLRISPESVFRSTSSVRPDGIPILTSPEVELHPRSSSRTTRKLGEVGCTLLLVGVAAFLGFFAAVEQEVRIVGELLDSGETVFMGVEARFQ
jgi:hypothetical protein